MGKTKQCARCGVSYSGRTSKYCSDSCYVQSKAESRRRRVYGEDSLVTCEICEAKLSSPGGLVLHVQRNHPGSGFWEGYVEQYGLFWARGWFFDKVRVGEPEECWEWDRFRDSQGYGWAYLGGRRIPAARLAYEVSHGLGDPSLLACHHCDNPPCCNPDHIYLGTRLDNRKDMVARGRFDPRLPEHREYGELEIVEAFRLRASGSSIGEIATCLGMGYSSCKRILSRKTWGWVEIAPEIVQAVTCPR